MSLVNVKCNINQCEFNKDNSCINKEIEINLICDEYEQATCSNYNESKESIRSNYHIQKLNIDETGYGYIIFSRDYYGAYSYIGSIAEDIKELEGNDCNVKIIFDNLLHNGNSENRFIEMHYDNMFNPYNASAIKFTELKKSHPIRKISMEYYKSNPKLLECGTINSVQKKMILKGMVI